MSIFERVTGFKQNKDEVVEIRSDGRYMLARALMNDTEITSGWVANIGSFSDLYKKFQASIDMVCLAEDLNLEIYFYHIFYEIDENDIPIRVICNALTENTTHRDLVNVDDGDLCPFECDGWRDN